MTTQTWDADLEADLEEARRRDARGALLLIGLIVLIGAASVIADGSRALAGDVPAIGRVMLGFLAVVAGIAVRLQYVVGWRLAAAWAALQIPFVAWSLAGSPTSQALMMPFTIASTVTVGQHSDHFAIGINLAGVIFLVWLTAWRYRFNR